MMRFAFLLAFTFAVASAFTTQPWGATKHGQTARFMFSADGDQSKPKPLEEIPVVPDSLASVEEEMAIQSKNVVRNMNTGEVREVKWVDPAMSANTNPFQMNWWAYLMVGFPFVILANDFLHFLPEEGPLGVLGKM